MNASYILIYCIINIATMLVNNTVDARATLIMLYGTACAGKSSIIHELYKLDARYKSLDSDNSLALLVDFIEQEFAEDFLIISTAIARENIFHAVKLNMPLVRHPR